MKVSPNPPLKPVLMRQKHEIGSKILREIIDEELNDLLQLNNSIKHIEGFIKHKNKISKYHKEIVDQLEKLVYGNSASNSQEQKQMENQNKNKGVFKRMITRKNINASTVDQAANMIESLDTDLISNLEI